VGTQFARLRGLIAKTIQDVSPDGYRLKCWSPESATPEEIVRQMVEKSSQHLDSILAK